MTSVRETMIRGLVQFTAALAVIAGVIGLIIGWRYGHGLITAGLAIYVATFFNRRMSFHRSMGGFELMQAQGDNALQHIESAVRSYRKLAAKRPREATYLADALGKQ